MPGLAQREQRAAALEDPGSWNSAAWPNIAPGTAPDVRHSRRVALLKRVLPAIGLALLLLIAVWPRLAPLWERMRLAFPAIDLREARELRMINPRYAGNDRLGRPYVVTAAVGRQVPNRQDLMSLEAPRADLKTRRGADITVTAATGIYQSQAQLLDLFGEVTLVHQNGTRFVTDSARVDAANSTAEGSDPVAGHGPSGDVKSEGFRVLDKGDSIVFTGKSDMLLRGTKTGAEKSAPAALPAPVAATAAQVEAAAKPLFAAMRPGPAAQHHSVRRPAQPHGGHQAPVHAKPVAKPMAKPVAKPVAVKQR